MAMLSLPLSTEKRGDLSRTEELYIVGNLGLVEAVHKL